MNLKLEKRLIDRDGDQFVRVTVFEEEDAVWLVRDITHHNNDTDADAYVSMTWRIVPPALGAWIIFPAPDG